MMRGTSLDPGSSAESPRARALLPGGDQALLPGARVLAPGVLQEEVLLQVGHARVRVVAHCALERRGGLLPVMRLAVRSKRGQTGADFRTLRALELVDWRCRENTQQMK